MIDTVGSEERSAKSLVFDMEADLATIRNLANSILFAAAELDLEDEVRSAIECLAYIILDKTAILEKLRRRAARQDRSSEEDAELLALGQQLDQVEERWKDRRIKDIRGQDDDPELEIWTSIHDQLYPLAEHILRRKALTEIGLALQARATSMVFSEYWMPAFFDKGGVDSCDRLFLEAVCSFAGTLVVPIAAERVVTANAFPMATERAGSDEAADRAERT